MKTTFKQLTAGIFIALLLMVGSINAEAAETKTSCFGNIETELQLEKWMVGETSRNTNLIDITGFVQETEAELELAGWMVNTESLNENFCFNEVVETTLELEGWMVSDINRNMVNIENEPELTIEFWMLK